MIVCTRFMFLIFLCTFLIHGLASYSLDNANNSSSMVILPTEGEVSRRSLRGLPAEGKRVALLQVHFEGNVGDQMETIPLLQKLKSWGVSVDCYLSVWMPEPQRLDPLVQARIAPYVDNVFVKGIEFDSEIRARSYDLLIVTPGPTVNELGHCINAAKTPKDVVIPPAEQVNISMAWFGVTITGWAERTYEKQKYCVKLIAAREEVSLKRIENIIDPKYKKKNNLMLSGDISFSYPYDAQANKKLADEKFRKTINLMKGVKNWVLIFSRENNFGPGKGVWFRKGKIHVHAIGGEISSHPVEKVVFASSSNLEDNKHMEELKKVVKSELRVVTCGTVEEMFALVSSAPHVVTDRYHPGVASMIVGTKLSLTKYPLEATKMHGLKSMQQFTRKQILGMNQKAFKALLDTIMNAHRNFDTSLISPLEERFQHSVPMTMKAED